MQECQFALHVMIRLGVAGHLSPSGLDRKWLRYSGGVNFLLVINATHHVAWCFLCSVYLWSTPFTSTLTQRWQVFEWVNTKISCGAYVTLELLTWRVHPVKHAHSGATGELCDEERRWVLAQPSLECVSASACCVKQRAASNTLHPAPTLILCCCFLLKNRDVFASQKTRGGEPTHTFSGVSAHPFKRQF